MDLNRVVIVGASLAGLRAAETLRNEGYDGEVVIIGAEPHRPYDRPPLSKKLLAGEWEPERIQLRRPDTFDDLDVEWRFGVAGAGLDPSAGVLHLTDGTDLTFDGCIIATGAACRRLPEQSRYSHVHELRTLDDAMRLRAEIADGGRRVVVIGAGFIGLEVAATAKQLGNDVTVLEGGAAPLMRGLGKEMGDAIGAMHEARGVALRCGVHVDRLHDDGVLLAADADADEGEGESDGGDGELIDADVVVVGIGVVPATAWLGDSGLQLRDGVVCDETLNALDADGNAVAGVYAAGDVLRWPNPLFGEEMRVEHWTNAAEQGAAAANNLLASAGRRDVEPEAYAPVPFFWSDQFDIRVQFLGRAAEDDHVEVVLGSTEPDDDGAVKFLALYRNGDRIHGALGVNAPRWVMKMRNTLLDQASWDEALAHAATLA